MNMVNREQDISISFEENLVTVLCLENPKVFTACINNLWQQTSGEEGAWILSDADKELNISKKVHFIINPLSANLNEKKIISQLYGELENAVKEQYIEAYSSLNSSIVNFIDGLIQTQPYSIGLKMDANLSGLLKLYDVKFETDDISLIEKLITYLKVMHQVCHTEIFAFLNLKSYLEDTELVQLYEAAFYEKVHIWLIESRYEKKLMHERVKLLDKDLCIIDL